MNFCKSLRDFSLLCVKLYIIFNIYPWIFLRCNNDYITLYAMRDFFAILFRKNRMTVNIMQIKQGTADATHLIAFVSVFFFKNTSRGKKSATGGISRKMFPIFFLYSRHNSLRFFTLSRATRMPSTRSFISLSLSVILEIQGGNKGMERRKRDARPFDTKATRCVETRAVMSSLHPFVLFRPFAGLCNCFNATLSAAAPRKPKGSVGFTRINSTWLFTDAIHVWGHFTTWSHISEP